jgi:hypothetical protein
MREKFQGRDVASSIDQPFAGLGEFVVGHFGSCGIEVASLSAKENHM